MPRRVRALFQHARGRTFKGNQLGAIQDEKVGLQFGNLLVEGLEIDKIGL
jgi:hypothetical protein